MIPKVDFRTNENLDKQVGAEFLHTKAGGVDFGKTIISSHPQLKGNPSKEKIYSYVSDYYQAQKDTLIKSQIEVSDQWKKAFQQFFKNTNKLFGDDVWPFDTFVCFLSIFNCNPRFLENGTFQVYYLNKNKVRVVMHELMHFKFYDYVKREFLPKNSIISSQKLWELSEIVNTIVLNLPQFQALSNEMERGYPELVEKTADLAEIYHQSENMSDFLHKAL